MLILLAFASAAPFLAGFRNIIGLVIIGIGLFEAWRLNKRAVLSITGPHTVLLVAFARAVSGTGAAVPDRGALAQFVGITLALAAIVRMSHTLL